jgi:hypothetical protein
MGEGKVGSGSNNVWRRKDNNPMSTGRRPLAQVEKAFPSDPAARLPDSPKIRFVPPAKQTIPNPPMASPRREDVNTNPGTVAVKIPDAMLAALRTQSENKASVSLLGRIQGKHPGLQALTTWAKSTLHSSLLLLTIQANNMFKVTFESAEGRLHVLNQADLTCELASIFFSSWRPHFDASQPNETDRLDHPVWLQIVNLCQVLRDEAFLRIVGNQIGQVISVDNSEAYRAKLFGPRIRILVQDLDALPHTVLLPRLDGEGTIAYALEFSGLPNQCGRCRSREHQVRFCPKKEMTNRPKTHQQVCRNIPPTQIVT